MCAPFPNAGTAMTLRRDETEQVGTKDLCQDPTEVKCWPEKKTLNADILY